MNTDQFHNSPYDYFACSRAWKRKLKGKQNSIEADRDLVREYLQSGGSITKLPDGHAVDYYLTDHSAKFQ
ncbi:hypothetical protein ABDF71_25280 [Ochrobactrum sp. WV_118_8]|uniref:Uncharacterized protein n=1 Tax=Brucella tritici TaxID=94626 RepID=A0A7V8B0T0_9HYPH|nr:hypothetical protein [Brucella tritici]KAB2655163.1 hypothetical protein F9K94_21670 [Brucella tritici]